MHKKENRTAGIFSASVFIDDQGFWSIVVQTANGPRAYSGEEAKAISALCRAYGIPVDTRTSINPAKALDAISQKIKAKKEKEARNTNRVGGFKP
jgi:cytosine/adenosine deaminase-related metal-dependent hydrolase